MRVIEAEDHGIEEDGEMLEDNLWLPPSLSLAHEFNVPSAFRLGVTIFSR